MFSKKTFRYYYWLVKEFFLKHIRLITISFFVSFLCIIAIISLTPYLSNLISVKKRVVGIVGTYDFNTLPEDITSQISNGLLYINEHGELMPALATSWEVRNNGKEYRFHLRNNLMWDDGKKFSAADINYQFKDITIKKVDSNTVDFFLSKPIAIFPTYLRKPLIKYPLVGIAGLYRVAQIKTKYGNLTELSLEPNKKDLPGLVYRVYANETQLIGAYKKGEVNEFSISKKSVVDVFKTWRNTEIQKKTDYSQLMTLFFNHLNPLLKDKDMRDAINGAIDQTKFNDLGESATGPIQPISWAYNPNLKKNVYQPQVSEKVIRKDETSSKSGELNFLTYYDYYDIADEIVNELKAVELPVNLIITSPDKQTNFDFLLALWKVPSDPDQYYFWHSTQTQGNIGNYKNVKIDKLLEDGRNTLSLEDRKRIYFDYQKVIQDDPPAYFLYYPYAYTVKRK
jgi:peptide/nickel transport system substrate-binding protein